MITYKYPYLVRDPANGCDHACEIHIYDREHYRAAHTVCPRNCYKTNGIVRIYWRTTCSTS